MSLSVGSKKLYLDDAQHDVVHTSHESSWVGYIYHTLASIQA
jgi:hypothetical protein